MKIERMLAVSAIMVGLLMCLFIYDGVALYQRNRHTLTNYPIIIGQATTTQTNEKFIIKNIYESEDKTQALVVIEGNLSSTSYLADEYDVYLLGASAGDYSGGTYVFEDLNTICIYVTNISGFKSERTMLIVKSKASTADGSGSTQTDDMTFEINLGATDVQIVSFMDDSGLNISKMTKSAFSYENDESIRENLLEAQTQMVDSRNKLFNIRKSIAKNNMQVPVAPEWMRYVDDNGNEGLDTVDVRPNTGSNYIRTSYIFAGGADFDWENTTRLNNYADAAGVDVSSLNNYSTEDMPIWDEAIPSVWYHTDGSEIVDATVSEESLIMQYTQEMQTYYNAKIQYQRLVASLITNQDKYLKAIENYTSSIGGGHFFCIKKKL